MLERGEGKPGRGCCAQCWSPYMCALKGDCGCHVARGDQCRAAGCTAGLYVFIPSEVRPDNELEAARAALADKYTATEGMPHD